MSAFNSQTMLYGRSGAPSLHRSASAPISVTNLLFFFALHVPLALLMFRVPEVGRVHAWAALLVGAAWAMSGSHPSRVLCAAAYIAGSEVLWRMTGAPIFWEFGKYAVIAVLLLAIPRARPLRATNFPIVFFALLVPSIALTIAEASPARIRHEISFNLSGPLALAVCAAYCSRVQLTAARVQRMLIGLLGPVIGIVTVCVFHLAGSEHIHFSEQSSKLSSGGYGPNQVSSILGFGALAAVLLAVVLPVSRSRNFKWFMLVLSLWLAAQSALTLSRSGLYLALSGVATAAVFGLRESRLRMSLLAAAGLLFIAGEYVIAPRLDAYTGGALTKRFADTGLTGRDQIAKADMSIWLDHPLLGVGPGRAAWERAKYFRATAAHTEITRLVAEHGLLGAVALGLLLVVCWRAIRRQTSWRWKAFVASMITYGLLFMAVNAMRTVLPALVIGLAFASFKHEQASTPRR